MSALGLELDLTLALPRFELRVATALPEGLTAVMGPSGSGKTSLLETIAGLRPLARGRVVVQGSVLLDSRARLALAPERRQIGYVPQDAGLFPHLSVLENVRFGARGDDRAARSAIAILELEPLLDRRPRALSGGEKQRVALARALASRPRLLLLDEPLAALDLELRERVLPWLLRVREASALPCLYVTHNAGEALAAASCLLALRDGRVEAQGDPREMLGAAAFVAEARSGIENLLPGRIVAHDAAGGITRVQTEAGLEVAVTLASERPLGERLTLAVRAEDVLVAAAPITGLSARNAYPARILSLERTGVDVTLRCALDAGAEILARVTPAAVQALGLEPGNSVWLAVKSHSVRLV